MQTDLMANGPMQVAIFIFSDLGSYASGVYTRTVTDETGGHAVQLIGWGTDPTSKLDYWLVQNSWGKEWGEAGYFRIRRGTNEIGIEDQPTTATAVAPRA
jgi:C1A family cysteine protease